MERRETAIKGLHSILLTASLVFAGCTFFRIPSLRNHGMCAEVFLYANIALSVIMVALVIAMLVILIKNFRKIDGEEKGILIVTMLFLLVLCPAKDGVMSLKDLAQGTESLQSEYYTVGKKLYIYDETIGTDISPIINNVQRSYLLENQPEVNQQQILEVAGWGGIFAHTKPLSIEYYPNTMLVSDVNYGSAE